MHEAEFASHNGGIAQRAGGGSAQVVAPVVDEVGHDGGEAEDVATRCDLGAQRGAVQADGAAQR